MKFLRSFLKEDELRKKNLLFLINPSETDNTINHNYLCGLGIKITAQDHYVAPIYSKEDIIDKELVRILEVRRPKYILINIGGGVQERLGYYLKIALSYKPGIICTGAAVSFLTGNQASIPRWADDYYFGWLFRCIDNPKLYVPRYISGLKLTYVMFNFRKLTK